MNKMIRIYSCNETDFSSNGLAILDGQRTFVLHTN